MADSGYQLIAHLRVKGMLTRLALAVLAAGTAFVLHPSIWPAVWLGVYAIAQIIDRALFAHSLEYPENVREGPLLASIVVNVLIFSSLAVYNWWFGGMEGKVFAAVTICCSLISITVTMYPRRKYLFAALIPHSLYLLSLPLISLAANFVDGNIGNGTPMAIVSISLVTYLVYMWVAVRKLHGSMAALEQARDDAQAASAAAEEVNAAKSNFLAVITHEIRTPMNAVISSVNLLKKTHLDPRQKDHVAMLASASTVLLGLLNDVLDLSKIEAGKLHFEHASVDLGDMLKSLEVLFGPELHAKKLKFKVTVAADVAALIMSDPLRLRQILFNLVSNAVKFTERGSVSLRVRRDVINGTESLRFEIEDTGIGISAKDQERIFSNFEQAETALTRRYGGTGLGLAISRRLARFMGGDITVVSAQGYGACFILSLPYEVSVENLQPEVKVMLPTKTPEADDSHVPLHVLIVDDHEVNRRIVSLFIEPLGWTHEMAENGQQAVERAGQRPFDIILMDMQMPVMDGISATRAIRQERGPNQSTPIVALTANALDFHVQAWREVGVEDVLTKPLDPELMITTLIERARTGISATSMTAA